MNLHSRFHSQNLVIVAGWYHCYWYKISLIKEKDNCFPRFFTLLPLLWICRTLAVAPPRCSAKGKRQKLRFGQKLRCGQQGKGKTSIENKMQLFAWSSCFALAYSKTREAREVGTNQMQKMQKMQKKKRNKIKE